MKYNFGITIFLVIVLIAGKANAGLIEGGKNPDPAIGQDSAQVHAVKNFAYTSSSVSKSEGWNTTIMRARLKDNTLVDKQQLFKALPDSKTGHHVGCRITFDGKGHIFFSAGERGKSENAQNL